MTGAHCLVCKDRGPDLVIDPVADPRGRAPEPFDSFMAMVEFRCGTCGRLWTWRASYAQGRWRYVAVLPAPSRPGFAS